MDINEFMLIFKKVSEENSINIQEDKMHKLYEYMKYILDWNEQINLTAIKNEEEFIVKHFIDSLTILKYINSNSSLIDIGTGAGFPGLPIKISNETIFTTLVDSVNKKINVLKDITEKMNIKEIELLHARVEDIAKMDKYREKYDYATSRAVSNLTTLVEYMLPFLKIGGKAICMKGPNYEEELENSKNAIEILGGRVEKIERVVINKEIERNIILIAKIKNTPSKYPREKGKPLKEPLY